MPRRLKNGQYVFPDHPNFRPNLSPREMFKLGSFGGSYWRPIYSGVTKKNYKNVHKKYPKSWWRGIPPEALTQKQYDKTINKYKVKVGTTLRFWEQKKWITKYHPYGWVHWYCDFFQGKRSPDDIRQIGRWRRTAGPRSRFRLMLINMLIRKRKKYDDFQVSPKIRQVLQHWAYVLTARDFYHVKNK